MVYRRPLCREPDVLAYPAFAHELREVPATAQQRLHVTVSPGEFLSLLDVFLHLGVGAEICLDELRGSLLIQAGALSQAVAGDTVRNGEIGHLGNSPLLFRNPILRDAEDQGCGVSVDVRPSGESRQHCRVAGDVGQDAQLDLGVVGTQEQMPRRRHECFPYLPSQVRPGGDVLQIWVG